MKISNIVATVTLNHPFNLEFLSQNIQNVQIHPKVHWLKYRIPQNNSYIAFYKSGKFLVTARSLKQLNENARTILEMLEKIGIKTEGWFIDVHNIVAIDKIDLKTTIENLVSNMDLQKASFEPEQFPALIYKDWGVSILLFSTGKIIITGGKNIDQVNAAVESFQKLIDNL